MMSQSQVMSSRKYFDAQNVHTDGSDLMGTWCQTGSSSVSPKNEHVGDILPGTRTIPTQKWVCTCKPDALGENIGNTEPVTTGGNHSFQRLLKSEIQNWFERTVDELYKNQLKPENITFE